MSRNIQSNHLRVSWLADSSSVLHAFCYLPDLALAWPMAYIIVIIKETIGAVQHFKHVMKSIMKPSILVVPKTVIIS